MKQNIIVKDKIGADRHIKAEAFRRHTRTTEPHRHKQYFEIVFLSKGGGSHWIDGTRYEVKPPVLFFLSRDQMHHWELTGEPDGYVVILKNSFLEMCKDESLKQLLHQVWYANCLYPGGDVQDLLVLFRLLGEQQMVTVYDHHIVDGLLKALIAAVIQKGQHNFLHSGLQTQLYSRYIDLLLTNQPVQRRVSFYATQLHTTPQNLNAACRKAAGRSASEILDGFIIDEAKRLLLFTDNNISEIAFRLSFRDPSYFVKFFKNHLQSTPEAFRKLHFQNRH